MLRPWRDVAVPHEDIRRGRLDEYTFMADLANVKNDVGPVEYRDPGLFFKKTYPTEGLVKLLVDVLRRLAGKGGKPVIQLQTPFGGGKSHSLIALYHLFRSGNEYRELGLVETVLEEAGVEEIPSLDPVVFVGTHADPLKGKTPWGEIGEQLGRYELVAEHDQERVSPGREVLRRLLGERPVLILMDEIAEYVARCVKPEEVKTSGGNLEAARVYQSQVLSFFHELTETLSSLPNGVLVATLPSSAPYGQEGERALNQLERIFGRMEEVYEPVRGLEIYEVVRRRLFRDIKDPDAAKTTVERYWELYQKQGEDIPRWAKEPQYKEKMLRSYPFHPELIDLLFERWGTLPNFQRTRGVLRLLALVVSDLYGSGHAAALIHPSHVNLRNSGIKEELLRYIESAYSSVIAADIVDTNAKAQILDGQMGEFAPYQLASGLATAIFLYSFSGGKRQGVPVARLKLATWQPEFPMALIGDTLRKLRDEARLWYLHEEEGLYFFHKTPNLNGVIVDKEMQITSEQVSEELRDAVRRHMGKDLKVVPFPESSEDVPDKPEPVLAVLPPEVADEKEEKRRVFVRELMEKCGSKYRVNRNAIFVLAPDPAGLERLREAVKRKLALYAIQRDRTLFNSLSEADRERLEHEIRSTELDIPERVLSTYRHLFVPKEGGLREEDLGLATVGERGPLSKKVREYLGDKELLLEGIAPRQLLKAFGENELEKPLEEIYAAFFRYPGFPVPLGRWVLEDAVIRGVREGVFALRKADGELVYRRSLSRAALEGAMLSRVIPETPTETHVPGGKSPGPWEGKRRQPVSEPEEHPPERTPVAGGNWEVSWQVDLAGERLSDLARGVLVPLLKAGAKVRLQLRIEATAEGAPPDEVLQRVEETLKQLKTTPEEG